MITELTAVERSLFGVLANGDEVYRYTLTNENGTRAVLSGYGACIQSLVYRGRDVVLGYDTLQEYETTAMPYQGATVGRYANRIANGSFALNGQPYTLACNENGRSHLHGGLCGFDRKNWIADIVPDGIRFSCDSPDGEEGYPGHMRVSVTMTLTADDALRLVYEAQSDQDTILNLTNHAFFNLNGFDGGDILDTELTIWADSITPVDESLIPTGVYLPVAGTPFDFRLPKPIGRDIGDTHPQMLLGQGYDHNYVLGESMQFRKAASAFAPCSGIRLDCYTDQPGVQLFTANTLAAQSGKGGIPLYPYQGFCLETQHFPDSPHHPHFPTTLCKKGDVFTTVTEYRLSHWKDFL